MLKCLAYDYAIRPGPKEVLNTCQTVLRDLRAVAAATGGDAPEGSGSGRRYPEPGDEDVMHAGTET